MSLGPSVRSASRDASHGGKPHKRQTTARRTSGRSNPRNTGPNCSLRFLQPWLRHPHLVGYFSTAKKTQRIFLLRQLCGHTQVPAPPYSGFILADIYCSVSGNKYCKYLQINQHRVRCRLLFTFRLRSIVFAYFCEWVASSACRSHPSVVT